MNEVLCAIRDADYHAGGLACRRLLVLHAPFFRRLREDVLRLVGGETPSDATRGEHVTNWTRPWGGALQFSLLNRSGHFDDTSGDHDDSVRGKRFHHSARYPALARLIAAFPDCTNFRANVLLPFSGLSPHEEHVTFRARDGRIALRTRFHLPVITNGDSTLMLDGRLHRLEAGAIFFVNNGCVHAAANRGATPRVHLVWDMLMTRRAFAAMFGRGRASVPARRAGDEETAVAVVGRERIAACISLPRRVSRTEAESVRFCRQQ